jgi:hypothetical protein
VCVLVIVLHHVSSVTYTADAVGAAAFAVLVSARLTAWNVPSLYNILNSSRTLSHGSEAVGLLYLMSHVKPHDSLHCDKH